MFFQAKFFVLRICQFTLFYKPLYFFFDLLLQPHLEIEYFEVCLADLTFVNGLGETLSNLPISDFLYMPPE